MPVHRTLRPELKQFQVAYSKDLLSQVAPFWIRRAHRDNGHKPFKPLYWVDVSKEDAALFHDSHWSAMEQQATMILAQVFLALKNGIPLGNIEPGLRIDTNVLEVVSR
jgi:hypothetical protein